LARFLRRHGHTVQEVHRPPRNGDVNLSWPHPDGGIWPQLRVSSEA
jgi:hypothetical protein